MTALGELVDRFLRPKTDLLEEASACVHGIHSAHVAWNRLSSKGLIPDELHIHERRRFGVLDTRRRRPKVEGAEAFICPPSMEAVLTFASDPQGLLDAERLARTLVDRLVPWGASSQFPPVRWWTINGLRPSPKQGLALMCAIYCVETALEEVGIDPESLLPTVAGLPAFVREAVVAHRAWNFAVEEALTVPSAH